MNREYLGELVGDKVVLIAEVMNRQQYLPKIPTETEVDLIFDTSYPDIQPYLFRVNN
jgi:autophagy-related protein 101